MADQSTHAQNSTFDYSYSAIENEEVRHIRNKYIPHEENKMEQLRRLDRKATRKGSIVAYTLGIIGALILGIGMCCTMIWEGLFAVGVVVGIVGKAQLVRVRVTNEPPVTALGPRGFGLQGMIVLG